MSAELPAGLIRTKEGVHVLAVDSHLSRWVEQAGRLDIAEAEISTFSNLIPVGGTVIDAGACLGDHTATYAKLVGPSGRVLAFEPGWLTYQALWRNFDGVENVQCHHAALGSAAGRSRHELAENVGGSHLTDIGEDNVDVVSIDELGLGRLDFVHLDCEGSEPSVLRGAMHTLLHLKPAMVIEINQGALARFGHTQDHVYQLLAEADYEWREMLGGNGPHLEQRDILCLPKK